MRVLCTSDWHLGKTLEGRDRLPEQSAFIDELVQIVRDSRVDLVMVAGDIYDTYNPPAAAEGLFYDAMFRLSDGGRTAVAVIAGNHDNPERLTASSPLASTQGIFLLGTPGSVPTFQLPHQSGYTNDGQAARVGLLSAGPSWAELTFRDYHYNVVLTALPYPSESRLKEAFQSTIDDKEMQVAYSDKVASLFARLSSHYRHDTVNLAMSHIYVTGGEGTGSERPIEMGGTCAVTAEALPQGAHFIALGHLHRGQEVKGAPSPCRYTGSPLSYSFAEAGQEKYVTLIEAEPGIPVVIHKVPLTSGKPLVRWVARGGTPEVYRWILEGKDLGSWVDLELHTDGYLSGDEVQALREGHPGIIAIRPIITGQEQITNPSLAGLPLDELFRLFHKDSVGYDADDTLVKLFLELTNVEEQASDAIAPVPVVEEVTAG